MDVGVPGGYRTFIVLMNSFFYSRQTDILAGMVWFKTLIKRRHTNVLMVVRQDIFHSYLARTYPGFWLRLRAMNKLRSNFIYTVSLCVVVFHLLCRVRLLRSRL